MQKEGGIYTIPCEVNGLKLRFIFDTGASNVSISLTEVMFMIKNGYIDADDFVGSSKSQIADGSIVDNTNIILRKIKIGNKVLTNVEASVVHSLKAPLLLGQSAIKQLGTIKLDGDELIITTKRKNTKSKKETTPKSGKATSTTEKDKSTSQKKKPTETKDKSAEAREWLRKAKKYKDDEDNDSALIAFFIALNLDVSVFDSVDLFYIGEIFFDYEEYDRALLCYTLAKQEHDKTKASYVKEHGVEKWIDTRTLIVVKEMFLYIKKEDYDKAIFIGENALNQYGDLALKVPKELNLLYFHLSFCHFLKNDYDKAIEVMTLSYKSYIAGRYGSNFTLKDLEKKNVKDKTIGNALYFIATYYKSKKDNKNYQTYLKKATAFGHEETQEELKKVSNTP
ncbi:retropepsin-like aspartic protease [Dysgonomonas sp. 520]|uniref:retropepsin-like aspartic protease n=1 Tax=Dysgonomonas sp. 520 TaxID=2302931 RepID=UPI0013D7C86F|nr:retropepsin-like aspartic protease [Dysgonomonas sp. 520]